VKCRKCGETAAYNMRQHKLALCKDHYLEWFLEQTERFIKKYRMFERDERVLVAVSGGKDSLSLWDVLLRLGYHAEGLYIGLGIDGCIGYSSQSRQKAEQFVAQHDGAVLHVVDIPQTYGHTIPEMARMKRRGNKPCSLCGMSRRHIMNRVALEKGFDVLATGHNLDDEVAVLLQNTLHWQTGYLARQAPVLPADEDGFVRKVKPFFRFYERETAAYAILRGIDYIYEECPHSVGATSLHYKEVLNQLEGKSPGTKLSFYLSFLRAREEGFFAQTQRDVEMHPCESCGQPTTAPGLCVFCRMWGTDGTTTP